MEWERKLEQKEEKRKEAVRPWTPNEQWKVAKWVAKSVAPDFKLDDWIKPVFENLCLYFTKDPRFNGDLNKGIMLVGNVGVGKTLLMRAFARNKRQCFDIIKCRTVADEFSEDGPEMMPKYYDAPKSLIGTFEYFLQKQIGYCFDDIGTEDAPAHYYKNSMNVMEKVILNRYDNRLPYDLTHFTTNLPMEDIEASYGTRVRSRLREMVNLIELPGDDRRK